MKWKRVIYWVIVCSLLSSCLPLEQPKPNPQPVPVSSAISTARLPQTPIPTLAPQATAVSEAQPLLMSAKLMSNGPGWNDTNIATAFAPRNRRGRNPVYSALGIARQALTEDGGAGSGNFYLGVPVLRLPGRGLDLALDLHYNSLLWHNAGTMIFNIDGDWPAPGWSLGFGKLSWYGNMLTDADGTRHRCVSNGARNSFDRYDCHTEDGSFIDLIWQERNWAEVRHPNGTTVDFNVLGTDWLYPSRITDANGNYISITYRNNTGPAIDTIVDTLGRVVRFYYDQHDLLTAIEAPGLDSGTRTLVRLHYRGWDLKYDFAPGLIQKDCEGQACVNPLVTVATIDAIYFPGSTTGYWFGDNDSFSPYGMVRKVSERRGMVFTATALTQQGEVTAGIMTHERVYDYPTKPDPQLTDAPTYTTVTERWAGMDTQAAVTSYRIKQGNTSPTPTPCNDVVGEQPPTRAEVTYPDQTGSIQLSYNSPCRFYDGLNHYTALIDKQNKIVQETITTWEEGDYKSPRIKRQETTIEPAGHKTVTDFSYGPEHNQVTDVRTYDYDGVTLLRREQTEYVTDPGYAQNHIFNLPRVVQLFEGSAPTPASRVEYAYDSEPLADTPGVVAHSIWFDPLLAPRQTRCVRTQREFDPESRPPWVDVCVKYQTVSLYNRTHRGNITAITRYTDAANGTGAVVEKRHYDITGNLISSAGACCEETAYTYTADTQYAYPTTVSRGAMDPASTTRITTNTSYDFNTGVVLSTTDANSQTTLFTYWREPLRVRAEAWSAGGWTTYDYDDAALTVTQTTYDDSGQVATQAIRLLNGVGLVRRSESRADGGAWDVTETQYDVMGRAWKQTQPFRLAARPEDEQKYWNEMTYDTLGRVTQVRMADGSASYQYYNEAKRPDAATPAPGQTVRTVDPWGRERWTRTNALGQLVEVVLPNPVGSGAVFDPGTTATQYRYNALGDLVEAQQGPQVRRFRYDSLGRLTQQYLPEKLGTLDDAGQYSGPGSPWSDVFAYDERSNLTAHTDARGVRTIYTYADDPLKRLQAVTYDTTAVGDTSSPVLPSGPVHYEYMPTGDVTRLWRVTTDGLSTEEYTYNTHGRLSTKILTLLTQPAYPLAIGYGYDSLNRPSEITYPAQYGVTGSPRKVAHLDYGQAGGVNTVTVDGQQYGSLGYNPAGQLADLTIGAAGPNQINEHYQYDPPTQLLVGQQVIRAGTPLLDLAYDYVLPKPAGDPGGNWPSGRTGQVTQVVNNLNPAGNRTYSYDAWGRLAKAWSGSSRPRQFYDWVQEYSYDVYGNRTDVKVFGPPPPFVCPDPTTCTPPPALELPPNMRDGLGALAYDAKTNRITTAGFAYDAAGNQIRTRRPDGHAQQYQYDAAGRLVQVLDETGKAIEAYAYYAATNQRLSTRYGDAAVKPQYYVWDGNAVIAEYQDIPRGRPTLPGNGDDIIIDPPLGAAERLQKTDLRWAKSYLYVGARLLATISPDANGAGEFVQYYHPDRLSTRLITNATNNDVALQETFPFGTEMPGGSSGDNSRRFTSYERSAATGLDYAVNRHYDPAQGRFMQVDPLGFEASQAGNLYGYVRNDPSNLIDPNGLKPRLHCFEVSSGRHGRELTAPGKNESVVVGSRPGWVVCTIVNEVELGDAPPSDPLVISDEKPVVDGSGNGKKPDRKSIPPELQVCKGALDWENTLLGKPTSPIAPSGGYPLISGASTPQMYSDQRSEFERFRARQRAELDAQLKRDYPTIPLEISRVKEFFDTDPNAVKDMNEAIQIVSGVLPPPVYLSPPPPPSVCGSR